MTQPLSIVPHNRDPICIVALYNFTQLGNPADYQKPLQSVCEEQGVRGTLLLAKEGVNGTIAGSDAAIETVLGHIRTLPGCANIDFKESRAPKMPFLRMKVRVKKEIVTMGQPDLDPVGDVGTYVDPQDWNALIEDPGTILIDTRNDYEVGIGTFTGAIDPKTNSFREFPEWFRQHRSEWEVDGKMPKVAMFCTGGIRCEKSTAFLRSEGIEEVYHLKGGILKYLENVPETESRWEGECFVFDERVSVKHGLQIGSHTLCRACRNPIGPEDLKSELFEAGISCPNCYHTRSEEQRARYAERQKQAELARERGQAHIGLGPDLGPDFGPDLGKSADDTDGSADG